MSNLWGFCTKLAESRSIMVRFSIGNLRWKALEEHYQPKKAGVCANQRMCANWNESGICNCDEKHRRSIRTLPSALSPCFTKATRLTACDQIIYVALHLHFGQSVNPSQMRFINFPSNQKKKKPSQTG